jgi:hypothetical protein
MAVDVWVELGGYIQTVVPIPAASCSLGGISGKQDRIGSNLSHTVCYR